MNLPDQQRSNREKWQQERTDAISEMFDNVGEHGIYPTGKLFERIDAAWDISWKAAEEAMLGRVRDEIESLQKSYMIQRVGESDSEIIKISYRSRLSTFQAVLDVLAALSTITNNQPPV